MASRSKLSAPVTEQQMATAIALPKTISGRTVWAAKSNAAWAEARWVIRHEMTGVDLKMVASINTRAPEKHTVAILWNEVRVAGICARTPHANKHTDQARFGWEVHEHVWTDACNGTWCRAVTLDLPTLRQAVNVLCASFGVSFRATWNEPPLQYQVGIVTL